MGVLNEAFKLTTAVMAWDRRPQVRALLRRADNSPGGHLARAHGADLYAYLLIDQLEGQPRGQLKSVPGVGLSSAERSLLWSVQRFTEQLLCECVDSIHPALRRHFRSLHPYNYLDEDLKFPIEVQETTVIDLELAEVVADAVGASQPAGILREVPEAYIVESSPSEVYSIVQTVGKQLPGRPDESSDQIRSWMYAQPKDAPERTIIKYAVALISLRMILSTISRLLFQALKMEQLPSVDETNVFHMVKFGEDVLGPYLIVRCLDVKEFVHLQRKDIVFGDLTIANVHIDQPLWVSGTQWKSDQNTGHERVIITRIPDVDGNPFPGLARGFADLSGPEWGDELS